MGVILLPDKLLRTIPCHLTVSSSTYRGQGSHFGPRWQPPSLRRPPNRRRKLLYRGEWMYKSIPVVYSSMDDGSDKFADLDDGNSLEKSDASETYGAELMAVKKALSEAQVRQEATEKERDQLLVLLRLSEASKQEHAATTLHDKELGITELEETKYSLNEKLQTSLGESTNLQSKLLLAKLDAVELAVQVEKLAEISFQQATAQALEDAQARVSAAESSAAEAAYQIEKRVQDATDNTIASIVKQAREAIEKALAVADTANDHTTKALGLFADVDNPGGEIVSIKSDNIELQNSLRDLESKLVMATNELGRLKLEVEQARAQASLFEQRANDAEKMLHEFQESSQKKTLQQEEEIKTLFEKMQKDAAERNKSTSKDLKDKLEAVNTAIEAAKEVALFKDKAYIRRCEALQRSLKASEANSMMWRKRAEVAESLLAKEKETGKRDKEMVYAVNGGRLDFVMDDSQKWKLLSDGPRRKMPERIAQRINSICPKFPPRKINISEPLSSQFRTLELPKPDEVWSIAQEKPKEGDTLIEHVIEKEIISKKRKALERALQRKTIQWEKTPEQTKLEPGTGTGREIVFQGFNWESWRKQWYLDLAPKAADLSHCGITAVWFPPPTESVAPQGFCYCFYYLSHTGSIGQRLIMKTNGHRVVHKWEIYAGYMPSDLYNLNSAYGTKEELKYCVEEMHNQHLLALGDVVLNHRCAQKQSPNGVWNIYGGKLSWGPEAIVCDDPNFQGCGNPSSGDIFHAAPNIDHSQDFVQRDIKEWLNWLRNDIGFDGWRIDFARGFSGGFMKDYIEASHPAFSIGEYWDSLAYEGGNLCYNQDAHRQRIVNWINATGGTSSAFDVTTKGILHSALHGQYWRLIDPQGKPTGVMGWWPSRAVTFLENHDTGSTQGHWPFPRDKLVQGYAYILTHPGTPVVFYDHFYDFGIREIIVELIEARRRAGIHCRSPIKIYHANNDGYVAQIDDTLVMKIGHFDWNPSKEIRLDGSWQKFVDKGADYQLWLRQ